jgi:hypothetical protein
MSKEVVKAFADKAKELKITSVADVKGNRENQKKLINAWKEIKSQWKADDQKLDAWLADSLKKAGSKERLKKNLADSTDIAEVATAQLALNTATDGVVGSKTKDAIELINDSTSTKNTSDGWENQPSKISSSKEVKVDKNWIYNELKNLKGLGKKIDGTIHPLMNKISWWLTKNQDGSFNVDNIRGFSSMSINPTNLIFNIREENPIKNWTFYYIPWTIKFSDILYQDAESGDYHISSKKFNSQLLLALDKIPSQKTKIEADYKMDNFYKKYTSTVNTIDSYFKSWALREEQYERGSVKPIDGMIMSISYSIKKLQDIKSYLETNLQALKLDPRFSSYQAILNKLPQRIIDGEKKLQIAKDWVLVDSKYKSLTEFTNISITRRAQWDESRAIRSTLSIVAKYNKNYGDMSFNTIRSWVLKIAYDLDMYSGSNGTSDLVAMWFSQQELAKAWYDSFDKQLVASK